MVKVQVSFQMSRLKRDLWWPSRMSFCIPMIISNRIFSVTGCICVHMTVCGIYTYTNECRCSRIHSHSARGHRSPFHTLWASADDSVWNTPQTEEIGLEITTTAKIEITTSFHGSLRHFHTSFHGSPQNFKQLSQGWGRQGSLSLKRVDRKTVQSGDANILNLVSSVSDVCTDECRWSWTTDGGDWN